jgi:hypothetical protein
MDTRADDAADGQWMTYAELGRARGISKESALKLALRKKWRKQDDNHGHVRVYVPPQWAAHRDIGADARADERADISRTISALEATLRTELAALRVDRERELAVLTEQIERERGRADQAEEGRKVEAVARTRAEAEASELRQAEADRRSLGVLARLKLAWRGD